MTATTGREEKTMGIEIEFFGVHRTIVISALKNAGINAKWEGYTHRIGGNWKLVTDGSVTATGTGVEKGLELVSPPLNERDMTAQLKIVTQVLNEIGAKVDRNCGVHVHHHIDDFKVEQVKNIYKLYDKHVEAIEAILPESRRGISQPRFCSKLDSVMLNQIYEYWTIESIASAREFGRFYTINMQSYLKYGTVEFRQHSGTIDFEKIINWMKITQAIVATAKNKKNIRITGKAKTMVHRNYAFLQELGLRNTEQGKYFMTRKDDFKELNNQIFAMTA